MRCVSSCWRTAHLDHATRPHSRRRDHTAMPRPLPVRRSLGCPWPVCHSLLQQPHQIALCRRCLRRPTRTSAPRARGQGRSRRRPRLHPKPEHQRVMTISTHPRRRMLQYTRLGQVSGHTGDSIPPPAAAPRHGLRARARGRRVQCMATCGVCAAQRRMSAGAPSTHSRSPR